MKAGHQVREVPRSTATDTMVQVYGDMHDA